LAWFNSGCRQRSMSVNELYVTITTDIFILIPKLSLG
jgi:hypothetical protein